MAKWLNCCGEADHLLFCNHYSALLTYTNTQFSNSKYSILYTLYSILYTLNTQYSIPNPANQLTFKEVIIQVLLINLQFILPEP